VPLEVYASDPGNDTGTSSNLNWCAHENLSVVAATLSTPIAVPPGETQIKVPDVLEFNANAPQECAGATLTKDVVLKFRTP
jgi:hypothetical protein